MGNAALENGTVQIAVRTGVDGPSVGLGAQIFAG